MSSGLDRRKTSIWPSLRSDGLLLRYASHAQFVELLDFGLERAVRQSSEECMIGVFGNA